MKRILAFFMVFLSLAMFTSCSQRTNTDTNVNPNIPNTETSVDSNSEVGEMSKLKITVGDNELIATLVDNTATKALKNLIEQKGGSLTVEVHNYGGFEKVGSLGTSLPTSDTQITATVGDIMLYQGNSIVIFYGSNSWSYTRLGKIENATKENLIDVLGTANINITLSLK